jgi:hypothetical protein
MPALLEQALEQHELGIQVLRQRRFVDDGDALRRIAAPLRRRCGIGEGTPLGAEHVEEQVLRRIGAEVARQQRLDVVAAGLLRARQQGIEQAAAGIGVDLDQLRPGASPRWKS